MYAIYIAPVMYAIFKHTLKLAGGTPADPWNEAGR